MPPMDAKASPQAKIGCSNPYVYLLPNGTVVDMGSGRVYSSEDPNGNTVCGANTIKTLSSKKSQQRPTQPTCKGTSPVIIDLTLDDSSDDEVIAKIGRTFSLKTEPCSEAAGSSGTTAEANGTERNGFTEITTNEVANDLTRFRCHSNSVKLPFEKTVVLRDENIVMNDGVIDKPVCPVKQDGFRETISTGRLTHQRKSPLEVRTDFSSASKAESLRLEGVAVPSEDVEGTTGTPWTFSFDLQEAEPPSTKQNLDSRLERPPFDKTKPLEHRNQTFRSRRISILREQKQEKLKWEERGTKRARDRSKRLQRAAAQKNLKKSKTKHKKRKKKLIVKIRDFKSQIRSVKGGRKTFRVEKLEDGTRIVEGIALWRKTLPKKKYSSYTYRSHVSFENVPGLKDSTAKLKSIERIKGHDSGDSPASSDNKAEDRKSNMKIKRGRSRSPNPRRSWQFSGRNSPVNVVSKDLWHTEMEKVEENMICGGPLDQQSYLLFLGLKRA